MYYEYLFLVGSVASQLPDQGPSSESAESQPLDCQGIPERILMKSKLPMFSFVVVLLQLKKSLFTTMQWY